MAIALPFVKEIMDEPLHDGFKMPNMDMYKGLGDLISLVTFDEMYLMQLSVRCSIKLLMCLHKIVTNNS